MTHLDAPYFPIQANTVQFVGESCYPAIQLAESDPKQDLASQPTLSRFEKVVSIADLNRLRELFVTMFIQSFDTSLGRQPPQRITLDLDAWDDETHGQQ